VSKIIRSYTPKFRKYDKAYPLTKFMAFLASTLSPRTVACYVSAIRRMLGHLGEGLPDPTTGVLRLRTWRDEAAVERYKETLQGRLYDTVGGALRYWRAFNGATSPLQLSTREAKSAATAALLTLLHYTGQGRGVPPLKIETIPKLLWEYDTSEKRWYVTQAVGSSDRHTFGPGASALATTIRDWGYPDGSCYQGAPFLPGLPGAAQAMTSRAIREMLKNQVSLDVARWLDTVMTKDYDEAVEAGLARMTVPVKAITPVKMSVDEEGRPVFSDPTVVGEDIDLGKIRLIDGKLVCENPDNDVGFFLDESEEPSKPS
jgi:hypothetical protein